MGVQHFSIGVSCNFKINLTITYVFMSSLRKSLYGETVSVRPCFLPSVCFISGTSQWILIKLGAGDCTSKVENNEYNVCIAFKF